MTLQDQAELLLNALALKPSQRLLILCENTFDVLPRVRESVSSIHFAHSIRALKKSDPDHHHLFDVILALGFAQQYLEDGKALNTALDRLSDWLTDDGYVAIGVDNSLSIGSLTGDAIGGRSPFQAIDGAMVGATVDKGNPPLNLTQLQGALQEAAWHTYVVAGFARDESLRCVLDKRAWREIPTAARHAPALRGNRAHGSVEGPIQSKLWGQFNDLGLGFEMADLFIAFCSRRDKPKPFREGTLGVIFHGSRTPDLRSLTTFTSASGKVYVTRMLFDGALQARRGNVEWNGGREEFQHGERLDTHIANPARRRRVLSQWLESLEDVSPTPIDAAPWNAIETDSGIAYIDQEWHVAGYSQRSVAVRGLVYMAWSLAGESRFDLNSGTCSIKELSAQWAEESPFELSDADFTAFVHEEASLQAAVTGGDFENWRQALAAMLDTPLEAVRGQQRVDLHIAQMEGTILAKSREVEELYSLLTTIRSTLTWRLHDSVAPFLRWFSAPKASRSVRR